MLMFENESELFKTFRFKILRPTQTRQHVGQHFGQHFDQHFDQHVALYLTFQGSIIRSL